MMGSSYPFVNSSSGSSSYFKRAATKKYGPGIQDHSRDLEKKRKRDRKKSTLMLSSDELFATKILLQHAPKDEQKVILVGDKQDFYAYSKIDCVYIDVITKQEYDFLVHQKGARVVTNQWCLDHVYSKELQRPLCISQLVAKDLGVEKQYEDTLRALQIYHMDSEHRTKTACIVNYMILQDVTELDAIEKFAYWEQIVAGTQQFHTFRLGRTFLPAYSFEVPHKEKDEPYINFVYETIFYLFNEDPDGDLQSGSLNDRVKDEQRDREALHFIFTSPGSREDNLEIRMRKRIRSGDESVILQAIQMKLRSKGLASTILSPERFTVLSATREKVLAVLAEIT